MARAETVTKLPLATWAKIMGFHPLHFSQVRLDGINPHCADFYFQHAWQVADHVSREEIAAAIAEAEGNIESQLGYRLAPTWEVDEWQAANKPFQREFYTYGNGNVRGQRQTVRANWGYFISGGIQSKSVVAANATIIYTDLDGDGYKETATVAAATTALDPSEIGVFYPGKDGADEWQIRPAKVTIAAGMATVVFRRELAVMEDLMEAFEPEGVDGLLDDNFLETVDIYRRYNDPQVQASLLWEPPALACAVCDGAGCGACSYATQSACLLLRGDPRTSIVGYAPGHWDNTLKDFVTESSVAARQPDVVRLYYYAGWRDKSKPSGVLDLKWQRTIAYYASALLDRPPCDCGADRWKMWRQDLALVAGDEDGQAFYRDPSRGSALDNPFGTRRGMVNAWNQLTANDSSEPILRSVLV